VPLTIDQMAQVGRYGEGQLFFFSRFFTFTRTRENVRSP
jgi:hypothetical protein